MSLGASLQREDGSIASLRDRVSDAGCTEGCDPGNGVESVVMKTRGMRMNRSVGRVLTLQMHFL